MDENFIYNISELGHVVLQLVTVGDPVHCVIKVDERFPTTSHMQPE